MLREPPASLATKERAVKDILLVSAGWVHPPYRGRKILAETLQAMPGYRFEEVSRIEEAVARPLGEVAAMVLYYHHRNDALPDADLDAFRNYVREGGGVLAVHSATASYKKTPAYFEVVGGRFVGHGPVHAIDVSPASPASPIFAEIPAFTVVDELYLHELQPGLDVHFEAVHEGKREPMVWTRTYGRGRVCYTCPGHRSASMRVPEVQEILRRGLAWVCGDA